MLFRAELHLLRGEFFEALGRADDAKRAFCASYRATDDAGAYARRFLADGRDAAVADRMDVANEYFRMARCIEPDLLSNDALAAELAVGGAATRLYAAPGDDVLAECAALRADADAASHAQRHLAEGVAALQGEGGASAADLSVAERHFSIAACIVPNHAETAEALRVVREALAS